MIDHKATDHELEIDDEYWDTLTHIEEENEMIRDDDSETDEDLFWDSLSQPEENTETDMLEKVFLAENVNPNQYQCWITNI